MRTDWVAEEVLELIFLLIVGLIVLVVSSFMMGYNMSESDWWKAMYTTMSSNVVRNLEFEKRILKKLMFIADRLGC